MLSWNAPELGCGAFVDGQQGASDTPPRMGHCVELLVSALSFVACYVGSYYGL
jgi:hypothetical protein